MKINTQELTRFGRYIALGVIFLNCLAVLASLLNSGFNPDELQHAHIAWNMVQGKVLYRDFFEHHGPLYAFLNTSVLFFFQNEPGIRALYVLRSLSLIFSVLSIVVVYFFAKKVYPRYPQAGLLAVLFSTSYSFYHAKAFEIRPDPLHDLFWLLGLYLIYRATTEKRFSLLFPAGIFLGLMLVANLKTAPGFIGVCAYLLLCVRWHFSRKRWQDIYSIYSCFFTGSLLALVPFLIYFYLAGALPQFVFFNTVFNFMGMGVQSEQWPGNFRFLMLQQTGLFLLFIFGYARAFSRALHKRCTLTERRATQLFSIVTPLVMLGAWLGFYTHYYMIFLPLFGLIAVEAFMRVVAVTQKKVSSSIVMSTIVLSLVVVAPIVNIFDFIPFRPSIFLIQQKAQLAYVLRKYPREVPFFYTWGVGSAHVFNADSQFYWTSTGDFNRLFAKLQGYDVFGDAVIDVLQKQKPPVLVGSRYYMQRAFSPKAYDYVLQYYKKDPVLWNLWERKE